MSDYQQLNKLIRSNIKQIQAPLKLDDTLLDICNESINNNNNNKYLKPRELSKILKDGELILKLCKMNLITN